jgi:hypothetical protein
MIKRATKRFALLAAVGVIAGGGMLLAMTQESSASSERPGLFPPTRAASRGEPAQAPRSQSQPAAPEFSFDPASLGIHSVQPVHMTEEQLQNVKHLQPAPFPGEKSSEGK